MILTMSVSFAAFTLPYYIYKANVYQLIATFVTLLHCMIYASINKSFGLYNYSYDIFDLQKRIL